ncbi:hypothetical protein XELAEV_18041901mg [Xenopus laevis]|uniref:Uncharacterized protein n=1 Tax=Xenopus laevis TaxID=8355 RepID=A0A974C396_XENLA|nr:hypothetical protein XELAEV_18041901mg [Xenopus laevis]
MNDFVDQAFISNDYAETWHISEADADCVLWQQTHTELPCKTNEADLLAEWEIMKCRKTDLDLHGMFLSDYYRLKRIPQGFLIRNIPTIGRSNIEFCKKWVGVLNKCLFDLMILVIKEVTGELTKEKLRLVNEDYSYCRVYRWLSGERDPVQHAPHFRRTNETEAAKPLNTIDNSSGDSDGDD